MKAKRNLPASVRQRLLNRARTDGRPFMEVLQYYAMERFLYRLSRSHYADRFLLKGALLLSAWESPHTRPTMDIDLEGLTSNDSSRILAQIRDVLETPVEPDGLSFDAASLRLEPITGAAEYQGLRIRFLSHLDTARLNMQVDIGFGDVVYPAPEDHTLPAMLDLPAPRLRCYSRETVIAEKFHAMVALGQLNSRMKDFFDTWLIARQFDFEGHVLAEAIRRSFAQRETGIPSAIPAFGGEFIDLKATQWTAFHRRLRSQAVPEAFGEVVAVIKAFLAPVARCISDSQPIRMTWKAPGPWRTDGTAATDNPRARALCRCSTRWRSTGWSTVVRSPCPIRR